MRTRGAALLLLAAVAAAGEYDADTLAGMDAEVREDWVGAVRAFERAEGNRVDGSTTRLRYAQRRGVEFWVDAIRDLKKRKLWPQAAQAAAALKLVKPDHYAARPPKRGVELPELSEDACAVFPRRSPAGRCLGGGLGAAALRADRLVQRCLDHLVATQTEGGYWNAEETGGGYLYDVGITSLAVLALLSEGTHALEGPRGDALRKAAAYLKKQQDRDGVFGSRRSQHFQYNTFLATEALAEYAVIAGEPAEWRPVLEKARDWIVSSQNRGSGWRYEPRGGENDTSVTGLVLRASHALALAGVDVPADSTEGAASWLAAMRDLEFGQFGYNMCGGSPARPEGLQNRFPPEYSQSMTAAGAIGWAYCHRPERDIRTSLMLVLEVPPRSDYPDYYYCHLATRAFQIWDGCVPRFWYDALVDVVEGAVNDDGCVATAGVWTRDGGTIYSTATCVLALAAPYRESRLPTRASDFARLGARDVLLSARAGGVTTGVYADAHQDLVVSVAGYIELTDDGPRVGADGSSVRYGPTLLRNAPYACLLGRVGPEGKYFRIHEGKPFSSSAPGHLHLFVNTEHPERHSGASWWRVTIRPAAE